MNHFKALRILLFIILLSSCVGKKKHIALQESCGVIEASYNRTLKEIEDCRNNTSSLKQQLANKDGLISSQKDQIALLEAQLAEAKQTKTDLLDRLADLSVINRAGAENIKKSLDAINSQNKYIKDLTGQIQKKDSVNLALVMNLKRSLADVNDDDVQIEVKKGVVYISISDKLLFASGSDNLSTRANVVLEKVAKVLNDHRKLEILVEGHTDTDPIKTACIEDNWDLSVKRATAVVRRLQNRFNVQPTRMTAGGRGEYIPKMEGESPQSKRLNRRTEIIVTPQLDQFFELLEAPN